MARIRLPANGWKPRPYQRRAWNYLERGGRHCELVWHRRSGKDELCLHRTAVAAFERVANYWHMLPEAAQARKAIWDAVNPHTGRRRIDEVFPQEVRKRTREQEMQIVFVNDSVWQVVGSDNFNSLVGSPPLGLVFSEWALCDPAAWAYLMPILRENGGWAAFNTTPRGRNHAYRSLVSARHDTDCFSQVLPATETGIFSEAALDEIREKLIGTYGEDYGVAVFEQEYLCSFEAANIGAVLGRWLALAAREGRISDDHTYDPDGDPIQISCDIGRRDASAWWFWQPTMGGFTLVDHDVGNGLEVEEWCVRLARKIVENRYQLEKIWLPHDARNKTFSAKHTAEEVFMDFFGAGKVGITPSTTIADRINAARRVIRQCTFHETNTESGRDALSSWSYLYDEKRKEFSTAPDHNWASHDGDAFSYGAVILDESEPVSEDTVKPDGITLNDAWRDRRKTDPHRISW